MGVTKRRLLSCTPAWRLHPFFPKAVLEQHAGGQITAGPGCMPAHQLHPPIHTCVHVVCCPGTEGVELEAAAAVPVVYGTADLALRHRAKLSQGMAQLSKRTALMLWQRAA